MGGSLKEQLLKAGLVNKQQVKKADHEKRKSKTAPRTDGAAAARQQAEQKAQRDRELNRQRQEETERKALVAQIKQLIEGNRLDKWEGELPYNFTDGSRIKRIYVTREVQQQLIGGRLGIAKLGGRHHLVPLDVAERIRERDPARVVIPGADQGPEQAADDPYAEFKVPDDLIW